MIVTDTIQIIFNWILKWKQIVLSHFLSHLLSGDINTSMLFRVMSQCVIADRTDIEKAFFVARTFRRAKRSRIQAAIQERVNLIQHATSSRSQRFHWER